MTESAGIRAPLAAVDPPLPAALPSRRAAWVVVAINLLVILWGAVVRVTGSGAGCGAHWPLCDGEVVPLAGDAATRIEFGHRLTSGLALVAVVWLAVRVLRAARSATPRDRDLRRLARLSVLFILGEAAIGAGIVLLEYVGENSSPARAVWMGLHLMNTFLLVGALGRLADRLGAPGDANGAPAGGWPTRVGWALLLLTGASGAIAALGDTLFPAGSLAEGLAQDFAPTSHILLRLRTWHPFLAIAAGLYWLHLAQESRRRTRAGATRREPGAAHAVSLIVFVQLLVGLLNLALLAPVALQLLHLLLADLLWIAAVLLPVHEQRALAAVRG